MKTLALELPESLAIALDRAVEEGGFADAQELAREALRRYIESHSVNLQEEFIREDVAWGLKGND
jgi:Arc/MetJ-type ribon-helix-helix transcriptional regulator